MPLKNLLGKLVSGGLGDLVNSVTKGLDTFIDTKGEKAERAAAADKLLQEFANQAKMLEADIEKAYLADTQNARAREIAIRASGGWDVMMILTGLVGLTAFGFMLYALTFLEIPEKNMTLFIHAVGIIEGVVISIFGYYFGTSKSSKNKDQAQMYRDLKD